MEEKNLQALHKELMELICDNCLTLSQISQEPDYDPEADPCFDCLIDAAVKTALDDAHKEGVTFACNKILEILRKGDRTQGGGKRGCHERR